MTTASGPSEKVETGRGTYPAQPVVAVGAVVFREDAVLLIKRGKPPNEGLWAIPGGGVRVGESLQAAAEREIFEETGVRVKAGLPVLTFDNIQRDAAGRVLYHYVIVDLEAVHLTGEPQAADDAADARWVTRREMVGLKVAPATRRFLQAYYDFE